MPGPAASLPGGTPHTAAAPGSWQEPTVYSFTLESSCGERALIGTYRVGVKDGLVVRTIGLDDAARRALMLRLAQLVPTLAQMRTEAQAAMREGADEVIVRRDPADGHPTSVRIDPDSAAVDDETCYEITDYAVGKLPAPSAT
ncbi:DUF6174 domain-containing protein [Mangrovihabitans endophyticus]|uniref:Uncharacterized protein n=1 Tax=Mangrovihabitans endophyticus TaxID=1751298 RepID=A0A8J3FPR8_9ACTN|nr:DUF6174 domain-containing protein [Mangrovihabitans endophyticus]GGK97754.1 hypothetical protein GCM10012284_35000 [Mangrovihabitans endophyticus]